MFSLVRNFGPQGRLQAHAFLTSAFTWPRLQVLLETG